MTDLNEKAFSTRAVHAGERAGHGEFTPVATPIQPSVGFVYESMDELDAIFATEREGYVYPRHGSPTLAAFEAAVANLEGGPAAIAFASGMAAIHAALLSAGVGAGVSVVGALDLYGATYTMLRSLFSGLGALPHFVDVTDLEAVEALFADTRPAALIIETISNPLLKVADIPALAGLAHHYGVELLVDNTFATPYLINPLAHGADYVIHSATKYIGGHGDVMAGVVVTKKSNRRTLYELNKAIGGVLGPFEAWLALRGVKTLPLRVRRQCENAAQIAAHLEKHPKIARVNYPGLASHPQHALASRLFVPPELGGALYGGMLSFEIAGAHKQEVFRFMEALRVCLPATTMGDIYTLVLYPPMSSHRSLTEEERAQVGIGEGLVRLSAGIEDPGDILADLEKALEVV